MKIILLLVLNICISNAQDITEKNLKFQTAKVDSIIESSRYESAYIFATGAVLASIDPDVANSAGFIGYSLIVYSLAIGPNSAYFKSGYIKEGITRSLSKSFYTTVTFLGTAGLLYKLQGADSGSISEQVQGIFISIVVGTASSLAVNALIIKNDLKELRDMYLEDKSSITLAPNFNLQNKSINLSLNIKF